MGIYGNSKGAPRVQRGQRVPAVAISCRPKARGWQRSACRFAETLDEALSFVRVLCVGMSAFDCSSRVVQHDTDSPVLVVQTNGKLFGDFATRSRIPFNVISGSFAVVSSRGGLTSVTPGRGDDEVTFQVRIGFTGTGWMICWEKSAINGDLIGFIDVSWDILTTHNHPFLIMDAPQLWQFSWIN